jgi:hypothetical protein
VTGAEFSGVDIDLLADYVGGALDGTPDEAVVAALIVEDPSWRDAHALLSGGVTAVSSHLRKLGSAPEPMPADVFARLDAALLAASTGADSDPAAAAHAQASSVAGQFHTADGEHAGSADHNHTADGEFGGEAAASVAGSLGGGGSDGGAPAEMEPGSDGVAPVRHLVAVPSRGGRTRARRLRWAAPVGIAAGVIAFLGFGIQHFGTESSNDTASSAGAAAMPEAARQADSDGTLSASAGPVQITTSGIDYRKDTLAQLRVPAIAAQGSTALSDSRKSAGDTTYSADSALSRLRVQSALQACIDAIAKENGAGAIVAQTVDFARFNGAPALIVQFSAGNGTWVWATGVGCGTSSVGAAQLGVAKVG